MCIPFEVTKGIFPQKVKVLLPQGSHHPEVDKGNDITRQNENITRMRVGMEKSMLEKLVKHQSNCNFRKLQGIGPRGIQGGGITYLDPVDILFNQDSLSCKLGVDSRDKYIGISFKIMPESNHTRSLMPEIKLYFYSFPEFPYDSGNVDGFHFRIIFLHPCSKIIHQVQVKANLFVDSRSLDLYTNLFPVQQGGPVCLCHGSGGKPVRVKLFKNL